MLVLATMFLQISGVGLMSHCSKIFYFFFFKFFAISFRLNHFHLFNKALRSFISQLKLAKRLNQIGPKSWTNYIVTMSNLGNAGYLMKTNFWGIQIPKMSKTYANFLRSAHEKKSLTFKKKCWWPLLNNSVL